MPRNVPIYQSHGDGTINLNQFKLLGNNVIFEPGVLVFHSENISIEDNVYVGHYTILKGYYKNEMIIGKNTWIGQNCFLHSAGGLKLGRNVGIAPHVKILTSFHKEEGIEKPILFSDISFAPVVIEDDCDIGIGATILPGVIVGKGSQVGAGAVVVHDVEPFSIVVGVPAKLLRRRIK